MILGILGPLFSCRHSPASSWPARLLASREHHERDAARGFWEQPTRREYRRGTLENEIERYFQLAKDESSRDDLLGPLNRVLSDGEMTKLLGAIAQGGTANGAAKMSAQRERLLDAAAKQELDRALADRLKVYTTQPPGSRRPRLASMFVTDANGTIVSIAYDATVSRDDNSAGRNYSYRTYFHGGQNDLSRDTPIDSIEPLQKTHLSAPFRSTATYLFKVAISLPIFLAKITANRMLSSWSR